MRPDNTQDIDLKRMPGLFMFKMGHKNTIGFFEWCDSISYTTILAEPTSMTGKK